MKRNREKVRRVVMVLSAVFTILGTSALGQETAQPRGVGAPRDPGAELATKITAPFTVAAVGDIIEPWPLYRTDPRFTGLVDHMRNADVGFANMESTLVDFKNFTSGVGGTEAPLEMGAALKAMGVTMMNRANNHTFDGGVEGIRSTDAELTRLGIAHAGTGRDLQEARAAAYQETGKGRVALVGMYSSASPNLASAATYRDGDLAGRPGENVLRLSEYLTVTPDQLRQLKGLSAAIKGNAPGSPEAPADKGPDRLKFFAQSFQAAQEPDRVVYEMNRDDERNILTSIRNGKIYADFLIATIHAHETTHPSEGEGGLDSETPEYLIKLAHDSVDNGADMFVAHGVHQLHGIEIYKGKPVFYGLSNFIIQFGLQFGTGGYDIFANERSKAYLEDPRTEEAVLATSHFEGGKLKEVRLYPADLGGARRPVSQIGIPMTPDPENARRILANLQQLSKQFGTTLTIEDNVGVIRVNQ